MEKIFSEQFFYFALYSFLASSLVFLFFKNHLLKNWWNRKILRMSLIFLGPISMVFFIKVLPDHDLISWVILSLIFISLPFIVTFLYKKREQRYKEKHKNYWKNLGYSERAVPKKNGKYFYLWKERTNISKLFDEWYRQKT